MYYLPKSAILSGGTEVKHLDLLEANISFILPP